MRYATGQARPSTQRSNYEVLESPWIVAHDMWLEPFPFLQLSRDDHAAAADLHRKCARHGVTVATVDCHIASAAMRHDCGLLTADGDFEHIARVARLRIL